MVEIITANPHMIIADTHLNNFRNRISALRRNYEESKRLHRLSTSPTNAVLSADYSLLQKHAVEVASEIAPESVLVQLGCNSYRLFPLLIALKARHGSFKYVVVDESSASLKEFESMKTHLKTCTQLDAVEFVETNYVEALQKLRCQNPNSMICVLWDGSRAGRLSETEAVQFLKSATEAVGSRCQVIWFTDFWENEDMVHASKDDEKSIGVYDIEEELRDVLHDFGYEALPEDEKSWIYQIDLNRKFKQVETYLCFSKGLKSIDGKTIIRPGEKFLVDISQRFSAEDLTLVANLAFFHVHASWRQNFNGCQILVPVQEALRRCWDDTDNIFEQLSDWMRKPIEFRHPYCFYYGHLMAFANLKLFDDEPPSSFDIMFSRGMDPIVVDPSKCHAHPAAPPRWPDIDTLKAYVQLSRGKIMDAVESGRLGMVALNFALEHERMHQETLMYMVVQQKKADFERHEDLQGTLSLLPDLKNLALSSATPEIFVSPGKVCLGAILRQNIFLWDNEYPILETVVENPILVSSRPVTVQEFLKFILDGGYDKEELWKPADFAFFHQQWLSCPATWSSVAGDYYVHYPEKTMHWSKVAEQPVFVSLSEAEAFCSWVGCRVMTESEYQRILECNKDGRVKQLRTGGWEWTSTPFTPFPGFEPMPMYPEYSADFFDGSHYVLKGSSPATHPSMIRDTFRNFYQRQYPYAFAKFRCCKSVT